MWNKKLITIFVIVSLLHIKQFLRAKAECFARLCHRLGVRPSVRHTRELYQNGAS